MRTLWEALDVPRPTHTHIHSLSSGHGQTHTHPCVLARRLMDAQPFMSRRAAARTQASPDPLALRLVTTQPLTARLTRTHTYSRPRALFLFRPPSCVEARILKVACIQMRAHSDSLPQAHSRPDPRIPRPTHIQTHSRPDSLARSHSDSLRLAQRLTRTESLGLPSGRHLPRARDNRPPSTLSTLGGSSASTGIPTACLAARAVASVIPSC